MPYMDEETHKAYREANKEKLKEYKKTYNKAYKEANKEKLKKYQKTYNKAYKEANKEKLKEYRKTYNKAYKEANKEKLKEHQKAYNKANKEKLKEYQKTYNKAYKEANKEKLKEYEKAYREANKEKCSAAMAVLLAKHKHTTLAERKNRYALKHEHACLSKKTKIYICWNSSQKTNRKINLIYEPWSVAHNPDAFLTFLKDVGDETSTKKLCRIDKSDGFHPDNVEWCPKKIKTPLKKKF